MNRSEILLVHKIAFITQRGYVYNEYCDGWHKIGDTDWNRRDLEDTDELYGRLLRESEA